MAVASPALLNTASAAAAPLNEKPKTTVANQVTDPRMIEVLKRQDVLDKIASDITEGRPESDRTQIPGFAGLAVDPDGNRLRLHWKGAPPQRVQRILERLPDGVRVDVVAARYSRAELRQAGSKLINDGKPVSLRVPSTNEPIRITSMGGANDGNSLKITYDEEQAGGKMGSPLSVAPAVRAEKSKEIKALTERLTGVATTTSHEPVNTAAPAAAAPRFSLQQSKPLAGNPTRKHDTAPWYGGSALRNPTGGICSSGFAVKDSKGKFMLTAAKHCDGAEGYWRTWEGAEDVGVSDRLQSNASVDTVGIALHAEARGFLYDGEAYRTDGYAKPVTGYGNNNVGDYVCSNGANGGVHCNIQITDTDIGVAGSDGRWRPITDRAVVTKYTPDQVAGVNGDSGGPVFAGVNNYSADEARGTITASNDTTTCPSSLNEDTVLDGHNRKPWCFKTVYYVPIYQTLHTMKWTIVTG
ncbi:S1 family peptidase [Streptomyces cinnamoneus]|uniref:S1 family peptidase n=1 Tax=Streptomyces cinnamoneus TaxID=53446 RepID=UPI00167EFEB2|nr:S1 family peptidase [Streptomyces cinnamoneus]